MIVRSLRWRLFLAMGVIVVAVIVASGVLSTVTVNQQFVRYLVAERQAEHRGAIDVIRRAPALIDGLRDVHARYGMRAVVVAGRQVVAVYPADVAQYEITVSDDGIDLRRGGEVLTLRGGASIGGGRAVYLLPPRDRPPVRPLPVGRALVLGLVVAALIAAVVMLTVFRRVFAPVEALTAGTRALARGELDARVDVRGNDEIAELARAFNTMAEALGRNERARRNMVTDIAHELRTPLTNIRVQLEAVQDGVLAPDAQWIASLHEEASLLASLVDDLQQLSLADAGQLRLECADVAVREIVARAIDIPHELPIACEVPNDLVVHADARRLVQVVRNLVANALRYAKSEVRITAAAKERIEIRVADDGPGVADADAERVFDRFYRADPSRSRTTGGAGLGLAIARQLVELHGGSLTYERPAFVIRLPR